MKIISRVAGRFKEQRTATLCAAASLHALAIGVLAILPAAPVTEERVEIPPIPIVYYKEIGGSDPGAGRSGEGGGIPALHRAVHREPSVRSRTPPREAPSDPESKGETDPATEDVPGAGGDGSGTGWGEGYGDDGSPGPGSGTGGGDRGRGEGTAPGPDEPARIGGEIEPPVLLSRTEPEFPEIARRAGISGEVTLLCVIDVRGSVRVERVLRASLPAFERAATEAVRTWRYSPALLRGRAQSVLLVVTVSFRLDG